MTKPRRRAKLRAEDESSRRPPTSSYVRRLLRGRRGCCSDSFGAATLAVPGSGDAPCATEALSSGHALGAGELRARLCVDVQHRTGRRQHCAPLAAFIRCRCALVTAAVRTSTAGGQDSGRLPSGVSAVRLVAVQSPLSGSGMETSTAPLCVGVGLRPSDRVCTAVARHSQRRSIAPRQQLPASSGLRVHRRAARTVLQCEHTAQK